MGTTLVSGQDRTLHVEILHVSMLKPFIWLGRGFRDMRRHWGASLGYGALTVALGWTLLGCTVSPAWDEREFELGERGALLLEFPGHEALIRVLTR